MSKAEETENFLATLRSRIAEVDDDALSISLWLEYGKAEALYDIAHRLATLNETLDFYGSGVTGVMKP